jgi:hypothetical protein
MPVHERRKRSMFSRIFGTALSVILITASGVSAQEEQPLQLQDLIQWKKRSLKKQSVF